MKNLKLLISTEGLPYTYAIFYAVGLILHAYLPTRELFIIITPYTLLLAAISAFIYHRHWNTATILALTLIFVLSILVEAIGVATGKLFGSYTYSSTLGITFKDVPLIIGINWLILVYGSNAILSKYTGKWYLRIPGAAGLMVVYDLVLEEAAPIINMWEFENNVPPARNYVMWFLLAVLLQTIIVLFKINTNNKPARALFVIQVIFFMILVAYSKFLIK